MELSESASLERPAKRARRNSEHGGDAQPLLFQNGTRAEDARLGLDGAGDERSNGAEQLQKEMNAGITAFVSSETSGFSGILKQRYTDFLVNEILQDGSEVHLTDLNAPARPAAELHQPDLAVPEEPADEAAPTIDPKPDDDEQEDFQVSEEDKATLGKIFGDQFVTQILRLYDRRLAHPAWRPRDFSPINSEAIEDRELRTQAHVAVRRIFHEKLETMTNSKNRIQVGVATGGRRPRGDGPIISRNNRGAKLSWAELGGDFVHFTLSKENKDTMEVVSFLAAQLKVKVKNFAFGGTKDKRAVTAQRISCFRIPVQQLVGVNRRLRGSKIGNYSYHKSGMQLGELGGNSFGITLRDCHVSNEEGLTGEELTQLAHRVVSQRVETFERTGFLNYYGLQRFGTFANGTDTVGTKLLQGDLGGAIDAILYFPTDILEARQNMPEEQARQSRISRDDAARADAIDTWYKTKDAFAALEKLPRKFSAESNLIRHLGTKDRKTGELRSANDFQGAIMSIPRNLRLMYVHAYQSLVWNHVAAKRWESYGSRVVEGDIVILDEHADKNGAPASSAPEVDESGEEVVLPAEDDRAANADGFTQGRALTKEEAESGSYSIFDIVLPLPGFDVVYPANDIGDYYKAFMASERGGDLDPHDMRRSWKDMSLSGGYRKLLARPLKKLTFEIREYTSDLEQMVETDLDRLESANHGRTISSGTLGQPPAHAINESNVERKKLAVVLNLQLGSSQYATMALRELTKGGCIAYKADYSGGR